MKDINFFKAAIQKEKLVRLNFQYLSDDVENWWASNKKSFSIRLAKYQLANLILSKASPEDVSYFEQLGQNNVASVSIINIFKTDSHILSRIVHEAFSDLFALNDIKYPYEEHKNLYLKPGGENYQDWGNGFGEIIPHSDDLYEDINTDFLSLTVCRDITNTPTMIYFPKDIFHNFTDADFKRLLDVEALFISGKNVNIPKSRQRKLIEYCPVSGYRFYLDFRIDTDAGERMRPVYEKDRYLFAKMRSNLEGCKYETSDSRTGTHTIVANYKVLHSRAQMNINKALATQIAKNNDYTKAPRLLYRSKGQDAKFFI